MSFIDATLADVNRRRWRTKTWILQNGKKREGKAFTKSSLVRLLGNELYIGHVRYQDKMYGGEQRAIMDQRLWKQVEAKLPTQKTEPWRNTANQHGALLHGILQCAECRAPMRCTYTKNGDRRYRYYVCRSIGPGSSCRNRVSAESLEASVMKQLQASAPGSTGVLKLVHAYSRSRSLDRADLIRLTREVIARVCYDRRSSEVTICMHDKKDGRGKAK